TGVPSRARQTWGPRAASRAETELPSVVAMTCSPTTRGCAYTSPSRAGDSQILWTCPIGVWSSATPVRAASWWYVVHPVVGLTVADFDAVVDVVCAVPP